MLHLGIVLQVLLCRLHGVAWCARVPGRMRVLAGSDDAVADKAGVIIASESDVKCRAGTVIT